MNMNMFAKLLDESGLPPYRVADKAGLKRNTVYRLVKGDEIPDCNLGTLRQVAAALGHKVVISFEPMIPLRRVKSDELEIDGQIVTVLCSVGKSGDTEVFRCQDRDGKTWDICNYELGPLEDQ